MKSKLISHRGYKEDFLENSPAAFEKALKESLSFETDIRISKDNASFMIHDDTLDRLFNGTGKISNYNSEELKNFSYKLNQSQKLMPLDELCVLIKKYHKTGLIFIHIKELSAIEPTIKVFEKYNIKDFLRFFAVDEIAEDFLILMKEKYKPYKIGLYLPENSKDFNEEKFNFVDFIWADEITFKWMEKNKVELAHKLKKPFYAISPELIPESIFNKDVKERWDELIKNGVDAICTGMPSEFLDFLSR